MPNRLTLALASAAIMLQACASAQSSDMIHVTDSEQIFSAANWTADLDNAAKAAGWGDRIPEMQTHLNETSGWPVKMKDGDARWFEMGVIKAYNVHVIARLSFYGQPAALLVVPAAANQHMPEGWKPAEDFYVVIGIAGLPTGS